MIANLLRANVPQRLIYIYDKTGFMRQSGGLSPAALSRLMPGSSPA